MANKRWFPHIILILVYAAGMGGEQFSAHASQIHPALRLWFLATDDNYQNARMVAFDIADQHISEEIKLPPDLTIISATWSPNENYIAAVVGEMPGDPPVLLYGNKVCVFSNAGELILCHEEPILPLVAPFAPHLPFVVPAPVAWTADNQQLVFLASAVDDQLQQSAHVIFLDVEQRTVTESIEVDFFGDFINYWQWFGHPTQAAVIGYNSEFDILHLYSVRTQPELTIDLLTTYTTPDNAAFLLGTDYIVLRGWFGDYEGHSVDVMRIEDGHLIPFQSLERVEYQGTPIPTSNFALSNSGDLLAFTSWFYLAPDEPSQTHLLVADFETGEISLFGSSAFLIEQLNWSPDDTFMAAQFCDGPGFNNQCHIEIFSSDGTAIPVDTGFPENRDPMWSSLES